MIIPINEIVKAIPTEKNITLISPYRKTLKYKLKRMIVIEIGQGIISRTINGVTDSY